MQNLEIIIGSFLLASMAIIKVVEAIKPAYKEAKREKTISIAISMTLGVLSAFAVFEVLTTINVLEMQFSWLVISLIGLVIGAGSGFFYDARAIVEKLGSNKGVLVRKDK